MDPNPVEHRDDSLLAAIRSDRRPVTDDDVEALVERMQGDDPPAPES